MLFFLKIFFERLTKVPTTFTALGNTYRNSKWTDLSIQNIKIKHISDLRLFSFLIILFLASLFITRGTLTTNYAFYTTYSWFVLNTQDVFSYSWILISSYCYCFYMKFSYLVTLTFSRFYSYFFTTPVTGAAVVSSTGTTTNYVNWAIAPRTSNHHQSLPLLTTSRAHNSELSLEYTNFMRSTNILSLGLKSATLETPNMPTLLSPQSFSRGSENIRQFSFFRNIKNGLGLPLYLSSLSASELTLNSGEEFSSLVKGTSHHTSLLTNDNLYASMFTNLELLTNKPTALNSRTSRLVTSFYAPLSRYNFSDINLDLYFNKTLLSHLNASKQIRWLTKFSWFSNNIFRSMHKFTHIKKTYGNPLVNANLTNTHLWGSTYLTNSNFSNLLTSTNSPNVALHTSQYNIYKNTLGNISNVESSTIFLLKRFYHLNFSKLNTLTQSYQLYTPKLGTELATVTTPHSSNTNFNLWSNFYLTYTPTISPRFSDHFYITGLNDIASQSSTNSLYRISPVHPEKSILNPQNLLFLRIYFSNLAFEKNVVTFYSSLDL